MTMILGPDRSGTPPEPGVYLVRVRTAWWRAPRWLWSARDRFGNWSMPQDEADDAARLLGHDNRIPERMRLRGPAPTLWRAIEKQSTVEDLLRTRVPV